MSAHLFVFGILGADVIDSAFPQDNGTTIAHGLDGCPNFHASSNGWSCCSDMVMGMRLGLCCDSAAREQRPRRGE